MSAFLSIRQLGKQFGSFTVLKDISLAIEKGEFVCFLGPSGCGKTTLLRLVAGLEDSDQGEIWQNGVNCTHLPPEQRDFGIVFQSYALFPNLTVFGNIAFGLENQGRSRQEVHSVVQEWLETIGLEEAGHKFPNQLSGGQQQNFAMGAVISVLLLVPAILAFMVDSRVQKKQKELFGSRSVAYQPEPSPLRDGIFLVVCSLIILAILSIIGMAVYGSLVTFWPWNLELSLQNYDFEAFSAQGWAPFFNSVKLAFGTAIIGTMIIFVAAYSVEKTRMPTWLRGLIQAMAMLPVAVPGMVLGLGYIFFFNLPGNPLGVFYGTMALLVMNTVAHYFTVGHLTALAALKKLPAEVESVAASLKIPQYKAFLKVSLPVCTPALMDIAIYLFVNAMTTTSAVVFLYSADIMPASVAVMNMEDAGQNGPAAAMGVLIMLTAAAVKVVHMLCGHKLLKHSQRWRYQ